MDQDMLFDFCNNCRLRVATQLTTFDEHGPVFPMCDRYARTAHGFYGRRVA